MDRFIELVDNLFTDLKTNLKSNMDRFIALLPFLFTLPKHLKSNMDRFIGVWGKRGPNGTLI